MIGKTAPLLRPAPLPSTLHDIQYPYPLPSPKLFPYNIFLHVMQDLAGHPDRFVFYSQSSFLIHFFFFLLVCSFWPWACNAHLLASLNDGLNSNYRACIDLASSGDSSSDRYCVHRFYFLIITVNHCHVVIMSPSRTLNLGRI